MMNKKFISWRRVSTFRQSKSGLGLEAQKEIIKYFVDRDEGELIADYSECYTGKDLCGCVELRKAMEHAKREGAILVIAKSDRFRNCQEALGILTEMGEGNIEFCDLPHSDRFTLTLFWALAEREALITSIRTKQALAVKKSQGAKLGASNEKYKQNYDMKTEVEKKAIGAKRGQTRNKRKMECRDTQALIKVLQKVFDMPESVSMWDWSRITLANGKRFEVLELMKTYKEVDDTNRTFATWDFDDIESDALYHKIANNIHTLKRSTKYFNETVLSKSYEETGNIQ